MKSLKKLKKLSKKLVPKLKLLATLLLPVAIVIAVIAVPKIHDQYLYSYKAQAISKIYVEVENREGKKVKASGTAFQLKVESGKIYTITNKHVCELAEKYTASDIMEVEDYFGKKQALKIVKISNAHDLCALEPMSNTPFLTLGKRSQLHQELYLIGHPGGRPLTLSKGHFIGPDVIKLCEKKELFTCIKYKTMVTAAISIISHPGNSGSPVVNMYGEVVGVLFAGSRQAMDAHMVPWSYLKDFVLTL